MKNWIITGILLFAATVPVFADVTSKGANGFNLKMEVYVPVDAATAYAQFVDIGQWWNVNHTYYGKGSNLSLEARAGGCFCEKNGENEVLHMLVTFVKPGKEVRMTGGLGPLQMMGVHGGMSWYFTDLDDGTSRITQTYNVSGYLEGGLDKLADVVNAVQTGQLKALANRFDQVR